MAAQAKAAYWAFGKCLRRGPLHTSAHVIGSRGSSRQPQRQQRRHTARREMGGTWTRLATGRNRPRVPQCLRWHNSTLRTPTHTVRRSRCMNYTISAMWWRQRRGTMCLKARGVIGLYAPTSTVITRSGGSGVPATSVCRLHGKGTKGERTWVG